MEEVFKDMVGFEEYFQISNKGTIFSKRSNRALKTYKSKDGYVKFSTKIGGRLGKCYCLRLHRLVALTFIPNPENKSDVNHIDGIKHNNSVSNLEWVTSKENMAHAIENKLVIKQKGVSSPRAKLSKEDVIEIRNSKESSRTLAPIYGVSHTQISKVRRFATYKDIAS